MSANLREPPDGGDEEDQGKKVGVSRYTAAARRQAAALVGINYGYLRSNCPELPQTGYISRTKILQGAVDQIRTLQEEI